MILHVDFETRSACDIKSAGAHVYAAHPTTDVWCLAYAFDDGPVELWAPGLLQYGKPYPKAVYEHVTSGGELVAHNAAFEIAIWTAIMGPRYGWPVPRIEQWRCTMAQAYAMALPGALENVGPALNTGFDKDMAGHRLMMSMARPRLPRKGEPEGGLLWHEDEDRKQRLYAYCKQDVEAERAADKKLLRLRPSEQRLWHLDQVINNRGIPVDRELGRRALAVVEIMAKQLDKDIREASDYEVGAATNTTQLRAFLAKRGLDTDSVDKENVSELLCRSDIDDRTRRVLEIRQEAGKASVKKIEALLNGCGGDGRARGLLQFHAASTGRWGGRRFQPQNIVKPPEGEDIEGVIEAILKHPPDKAIRVLDTLHGAPLDCVSWTLRGMVGAEPGKKIVAADFSNIEGRVLAWLAGEQWKVDYFAAFDRGEAPDAYIKAYCEAFGVPQFDKKDPRRQVGKVMELASGYQGGHGAYMAMIPNDKKLAEITAAVKAATPPDVWDTKGDKFSSKFGLTVDQWTAIGILVDKWRASHPRTKQFWYDMEEAAVEAIHNKGATIPCGPVAFKAAGSFLWCRLPSGRALCYPYPRIVEQKTPWGAMKDSVTFKSVVSVSNRAKIIKSDETNTSKWARISTYGGSLVENVTQAVARDVMAEAMFRLEDAGYPVVLTVHDEVVCEVDAGHGDVASFEQIMCELPSWAGGLPVAASGFEAERYRK